MFARAVRSMLFTAAVLLACGAQRAEAQFFGSPFFWYGNTWGAYANERIPYYSLFPPVYYKYPVPRTYGYSPFAYPPGYVTPSQPTATPLVIVNPYVSPAPAPMVANTPAVPMPGIIKNPYVK